MRKLLINFRDLHDERIEEKIRDIQAVCLDTRDLTCLSKDVDNYDQIIVMFHEKHCNFSSLLNNIENTKAENKKIYIIIDTSSMDEDTVDYIDEVLEIILDYVDGVVVDDEDDLKKFVLNIL